MAKKVIPAPGRRVTCREAVEASYSGYGGKPVQYFRPGVVGIVKSTPCYVTTGGYERFESGPRRRTCRCEDFANVNFTGDDGQEWRVGLDPHNIIIVE